MTTGRDLIIELTAEQRECNTVLQAFGVWNDVLYQLSESAHRLKQLGEERQAEAMMIDAESMARRARQHLRNIAARERDKPDVQEERAP